MHRDHVMLIGLAAVGAVVDQRATAGADILALMTFTSRTLPDEKIAMFAEIIAPRIGVVRRLVEQQRLAVDLA